MNSMFERLNLQSNNTNESIIVSKNTMQCDQDKMTYRDSTTLSEIILHNEKYQKRAIPSNEENKPIYKLLNDESKKHNFNKDDLDALIERDINSHQNKNWNILPCNLKKNFIKEYASLHEKNLALPIVDVLRILNQNKSYVKYDKANGVILWMHDSLFEHSQIS